MLSNAQADYLLALPKYIVKNEDRVQKLRMKQPSVWRERTSLIAEDNGEFFEFLWEIWQGSKNLLKMSLHFQEDETKIGLLRVDFWGSHTNPQQLSDSVPKKFHQYVGTYFSIHEHHVHYHVQGYPTLAWALPIEVDDFPFKENNRK